MKADTNSTSMAILPIAKALLAQVKAFGQFAAEHHPEEDLFNKELLPRFAFARSYFQFLEGTVELQFEQGEEPYVATTAGWPTDTYIAGYVGPESQVLPSHVVLSHTVAWHNHWENKRRSGFSAGRLFRAGLWTLVNSGLTDALTLIFDLEKAGYIINPSDALEATQLLIQAYTRAITDAEAVTESFVTVPKSTSEWMTAKMAQFPDEAPMCRALPEDIVDFLIEAGTTAADDVRRSTSYDEWILGQHYLGELLSQINRLLRQYVHASGPGIKAILDQFEEIVADAWPITQDYSRSKGHVGNPYAPVFPRLAGALMMLKYKDQQEWKQRALFERCLVPFEMKENVLEGSSEPLPKQWQGISKVLAPIYNVVALNAPCLRPWRVRSFPVEAICRSQITRRLFADEEIVDVRMQDAICRKIAGDDVEFQYAMSSLHISQASGSPEDARSGHSNLIDGKVYDWLSANKERVEKIVMYCEDELISDEITTAMQMGRIHEGNGNYSLQIHTLSPIAELYPTYDGVHFELAIAHDRVNEVDSALDHIISAIVLNPTEPHRWRSLAAILNHNNHTKESHIAYIIHTMILQKERAS
jgi:hypothetical protein